MIQFSNGGAAFYAGKGIKNTAEKAAILGAIAGAQHVRLMAKHYGVPVVLHSDHCAKKLLPWFDGMLEADEAYFKVRTECFHWIMYNCLALRNLRTRQIYVINKFIICCSNMVSRYFQVTCWTFQRSLTKKTFQPVSNISSE